MKMRSVELPPYNKFESDKNYDFDETNFNCSKDETVVNIPSPTKKDPIFRKNGFGLDIICGKSHSKMN